MSERHALPALVVVLFLILLTVLVMGGSETPPQRIFLNGTVLTMDPQNRIVQAVSIRNGVIEAVGRNEEIRQLIEADSRITDLQGKTLIPGFVDAHSHFPVSGLNAISADLSPPPIGKILTMDQLLDQIRQRAETTNSGEWILGFGYDDSSLVELRHPTRQELDAISREHPIYLWHSSGHMGVANSAALEQIGINEATPNPPGGVIGRDISTGVLNGLLQEKSALSLNTLISDFSIIDYYRVFQYATDEYVSKGITTAQSGGIGLKLTRALYWADQFEQLPFRLVVFPKHQDFGRLLLSGELERSDFDSERFYLGPVKIIADGSVQGRTAFLREPFYRNPLEEPDYRGFPAIDQLQLNSTVMAYHQAGFQLAIHGNGDAGIDTILRAFEAAQQAFPIDDPRLVLVHAQMARNDQLEQMLRLGITPSFFPSHTYFWGDQHLARFMGPIRGARMSPTGSARDIGLKFSVHTDAPVTLIDPMQLLWSTVNRESSSGQLIGAEQRIPVMQALRAMTIDAAWQVFQENNRGSIERGKFADLVILSGNPLANPRDIRQLNVLETIVGGKTVYQSEE